MKRRDKLLAWTPFARTEVHQNATAMTAIQSSPSLRQQYERAEQQNIVHLINSRYIVDVSFAFVNEPERCIPLWLSFRYADRTLNNPPWRDKQRIKNEVCGSDCEAVELYPHDARLIDESDQYHLWVMPPGQALPFGGPLGRERRVGSKQAAADVGATQSDPEPRWPGYRDEPASTVGWLRQANAWPHAPTELQPFTHAFNFGDTEDDD